MIIFLRKQNGKGNNSTKLVRILHIFDAYGKNLSGDGECGECAKSNIKNNQTGKFANGAFPCADPYYICMLIKYALLLLATMRR